VTEHKNNFYTSHPALFTDFYELAMTQGYFLAGRQYETATFDYFFRSNPFDGGYVVFCGLTDFLTMLENFSFQQDEIEYLKSEGFKDPFLDFLKNFRFSGSVYAAHEGEVVFPNEPVVRIQP